MLKELPSWRLKRLFFALAGDFGDDRETYQALTPPSRQFALVALAKSQSSLRLHRQGLAL